MKPPTGDGTEPTWFKSSCSADHGPARVEAATARETTLTRDSEHMHGPRPAFAPQQRAAFPPCACGRR